MLSEINSINVIKEKTGLPALLKQKKRTCLFEQQNCRSIAGPLVS